MRISILLTFAILLVLPVVFGQDNGENSQGDNGNKELDLDAKNEDSSIAGDNDKEAKPRKTTFKEERFEKLFNNRHRSKPRLLTPKYHQKQRAKLPSYIKNPPVIKPLGQDGLPVDDEIASKPTTPSSRVKSSNSRANISKATTSAPSNRSRARTSTTTTTAKPSLNDSDRNNKRFSAPGRGRLDSISTGRTIPASGRARIN